MRDFLDRLQEHQKAGRPVVVATIVAAEGSTPRKVGARMIIRQGGAIDFTLGGGPFEALVIEDAKVALGTGESGLKAYRFLPVGEDATGMTCGGSAEVFLEVLREPVRLVLFGGGHVALPLARLAKSTGLRVAVIDDREEFANQDRFEEVDEVVHADGGYASCDFPMERDDYVVIVTRCHETDETCLRHVLDDDVAPAYVGVVASRRKAKVLFAKLLQDGVPSDRLREVRSPVGLNIGAETPEELAVSILAEVLAVRSARSAAPLSDGSLVPKNVKVRRVPRARRGATAARRRAEASPADGGSD